MPTRQISHHMQDDRVERATFIAATIGYGEVIKEKYYTNEIGLLCRQLTDTGVIILRSGDKKIVITVYIADPRQIGQFYNDRPPQWILRKAYKNEKLRKMQPNSDKRLIS